MKIDFKHRSNLYF